MRRSPWEEQGQLVNHQLAPDKSTGRELKNLFLNGTSLPPPDGLTVAHCTTRSQGVRGPRDVA